MTDQPQPTAGDRENEARRLAIAARQRDEYRQVLAWADRIMGPGWYPRGRHFLLDKDEEERSRRTGERAIAAATVFTVTNGASKRHFMIRDGQPVEVSGYEEGFGAMLLEPHPTRTFEHRGQVIHGHRYSLCWAPFELYEPRSAEALAKLRQTRERNKAAREERKFQEENPLLAFMERVQREDEGQQR